MENSIVAPRSKFFTTEFSKVFFAAVLSIFHRFQQDTLHFAPHCIEKIVVIMNMLSDVIICSSNLR